MRFVQNIKTKKLFIVHDELDKFTNLKDEVVFVSDLDLSNKRNYHKDTFWLDHISIDISDIYYISREETIKSVSNWWKKRLEQFEIFDLI